MVPKSLRASSTIIAIDTDKLDPNKTFDVSNGIDPQTGKPLKNPAYKFATKDAEVLIQGEIPKSVILFIKREGVVKLFL